MAAFLLKIDGILRGRESLDDSGSTLRRILMLWLLMCLFGITYGAVMGSYGPQTGPRGWQMVFSGVKVPLLLLATFFLSLPSFFVLNTIAGLRDDFGAVMRALAATQAGLTIVLASFAPLTWLWYASWGDYRAATLFNALMFGLASLSAQRLLSRYYHPLIQRRPRHRFLMWTWLIIYSFVGIQMGWILRPFIGDPNSPTQFFRSGAWGNAYVQLFNTFWSLVGG
ncbi:MAG: hypothetical protein JW709_01125 [Sedimentisphaerales bacterium]|nr:hypothetical protein [Sedimentisphaerales bacterium]